MTNPLHDGRLQWVDGAKGLAIVMVVLLHFSAWFIASAPGTESLIYTISDNTRSLRMPLFFVISGVLISRALIGPSGAIAKRCANIYFMLVVWSFLLVARDFVKGEFDPERMFAYLLLPSGYWYLWALAVYTAIAFFFVSIPLRGRVFGLAFAVALYMLSNQISDGFAEQFPSLGKGVYVRDACLNFLWFIVGVCFRDAILRLSRMDSRTFKLGATAIAVSLLAVLWGSQPTDLIAFFVMSACWLLVALCTLPIVSSTLAMRGLQYLGKHTLIIYVIHIYFLSAGTLLLAFGMKLPTTPFLVELFIALAVMAAIATALIIEMMLQRLGMGILLTGPFVKRISQPRLSEVISPAVSRAAPSVIDPAPRA